MCTVNQLIRGSIQKSKICALLIFGVAFLIGCGSKTADLPAEAAPATVDRVVTATVVKQDASQTIPAYDSSLPSLAPSSSVDGSSDADSSSQVTTDSLVEPVFQGESDQSDLFVEREAIDALGDELFLEIISPAEDVVFVEASTFILTARTVIDAAVSINDDLVDIDEDGILELELTLEEGPNLVEVVTSLSSGEEKSAVLTIFYLP